MLEEHCDFFLIWMIEVGRKKKAEFGTSQTASKHDILEEIVAFLTVDLEPSVDAMPQHSDLVPAWLNGKALGW